VLRIDRFVRRIETEGLQPDVDAMANLALALECLERENYAMGEDAMMLTERGWAPRLPPLAALSTGLPTPPGRATTGGVRFRYRTDD
jgi:hypothetical protein